MQLAAGRGDLSALAELRRRWLADGAGAELITAEYAIVLSTFQLQDPETPLPDLFEQALADEASLPDDLAELVYWRYATELAIVGRGEEAAEVYRRGRVRFELPALSELDLLRTGGQPEIGGAAATVTFP